MAFAGRQVARGLQRSKASETPETERVVSRGAGSQAPGGREVPQAAATRGSGRLCRSGPSMEVGPGEPTLGAPGSAQSEGWRPGALRPLQGQGEGAAHAQARLCPSSASAAVGTQRVGVATLPSSANAGISKTLPDTLRALPPAGGAARGPVSTYSSIPKRNAVVLSIWLTLLFSTLSGSFSHNA